LIISEKIICEVMTDKDQSSLDDIEKNEIFLVDTQQIDCAICLENCVHPVKLKCEHIFCFLCVKGVTTKGNNCPMCRKEISSSFIDNPNLVSQADIISEASKEINACPGSFSWFYEGRNGWWEYEERAVTELEIFYNPVADEKSEKDSNTYSRCLKPELWIAGQLYVVDFERMVQFQKDQPHRKRRIKREEKHRVSDCKGVAGLRITK
jgi:E3 ubiquitin-protein ligase RNF146